MSRRGLLMVRRLNHQRRNIWGLAGLIIVIILAWLALVLLVDAVRFVVLDPQAKTGFEVFLAVGQLFGAFVLALVPVGVAAHRLRWVAGGFFALGAGGLALGYLYPLVVDSPHLNAMLYGSLYIRTVSTALIAVGIVTTVPPRLRRTLIIALVAILSLGGVALIATADALPPLIRIAGMTSIIDHDPAMHAGAQVSHAHLADVEQIVSRAHATFPGLTGWYWGLASVPLVIGVVAVWGAMQQTAQGAVGAWLLVALLLLAGAQLHALFWPSMYSSILTTTSTLRLGVVVVVITSGVLELRRVIDQRAELLATEQERVRRLEELRTLKADFTAIVAHELTTPLAAIRAMAAMLATGALSAEQSRQVGHDIDAEARLLQLLVTDVQASAEVEGEDFRVQLRCVTADALLAGAATYARALPDTHPITIEQTTQTEVLADPERIGQVLRNLLTNAIRYTPPGTSITLRATRADGGVTIAVADRGPGISPQDQTRIFEKFARGTGAAAAEERGRGLGLYLCRRLLQAHGSDLHVDAAPGDGATFWFTLQESR